MTRLRSVDRAPSLVALEDQVDRFRLKVDQTQARLDRLTPRTTDITRPPGRTLAMPKAEADVAGAMQGLRNTERILGLAEALRGREPP